MIRHRTLDSSPQENDFPHDPQPAGFLPSSGCATWTRSFPFTRPHGLLALPNSFCRSPNGSSLPADGRRASPAPASEGQCSRRRGKSRAEPNEQAGCLCHVRLSREILFFLRNVEAAQCIRVAQVGNLLYRRLAVGRASEAGGPADYQSAIQQTDCLRYLGCGWLCHVGRWLRGVTRFLARHGGAGHPDIGCRGRPPPYLPA